MCKILSILKNNNYDKKNETERIKWSPDINDDKTSFNDKDHLSGLKLLHIINAQNNVGLLGTKNNNL